MEKKLLVLGFFIFISTYPILYMVINTGMNYFLYWTSIGFGLIGILLMISGLIVYIAKKRENK